MAFVTVQRILGWACLIAIGKGGRHLTMEQAVDAILGFYAVGFGLWHARDLPGAKIKEKGASLGG